MPVKIINDGSAKLLEEYKKLAGILIDPPYVKGKAFSFEDSQQIRHFLDFLFQKMLKHDQKEATKFFDYETFDYTKFSRKDKPEQK